MDPYIEISIDTIKKGKQALVFVNTKRSAEKCAEDIAHFLKTDLTSFSQDNSILETLSEEALHAISTPTKQCKRLSKIIKKGIAFHHAGLNYAQRELIEENFKKGVIKVICCTPTLAIGLDLPAYRVIIRDLKRFGHRGLDYIPVLEYLQMAGRAGRPKYDSVGEAICIAQSENEKDIIVEKYIFGEPESIYSKLAVEPVLRTYVLSLISSKVVRDRNRLIEFFSKTFWAHQFKDMDELTRIIDKVIAMLVKWGFIELPQTSEFSTADKLVTSDFSDAKELHMKSQSNTQKLNATPIGKRVSELYVDPYTANYFLSALQKKDKQIIDFTFVQLVSHTLEMRPLLKLKQKDYQWVEKELIGYDENLLDTEPSMYDYDYQEFLDSIKTALFFKDWIEEKDEEFLLEKYGIRPGEIKVKLDICDWLLYTIVEMCVVTNQKDFIAETNKMRVRITHGAKEELLPLLRLKGIGRVRARILFRNGIKNVKDIKNAGETTLGQLLGKGIAKEVLGQV